MFVVQQATITAAHEAAEIQARPRPPTIAVANAHARTGDLVLAGVRAFVPPSYRADRPAGLLVMLHGAGGTPEQAFSYTKQRASMANIILLAPKSERATWDVIRTGFGPDVAQIDRALMAAFHAYSIDPARIAIGGFSDGASYALTLGLVNGGLFRTILAFSPGFEVSPRRTGSPRVFISHGTEDRVLPIARTSHRIVSVLRRRELDVDYLELEGVGHSVPSEALDRAFAKLAPSSAAP